MDKFIIASGRSVTKPEEWRNHEVTWDQLVDRLRKPVRTSETMAEWKAMTKKVRSQIKDVGSFIGGPMEVEGDRHKENIKTRYVISLDIDGVTKNLKDLIPDQTLIRERLDDLGCIYAMHPTHSSTPEWPRLRVYLPLSEGVDAEAYQAITRKLMEIVGIDWCDPTTVEHSRPMHWPSVPKDAPYELVTGGSAPLDPMPFLAKNYIDWHDVSEWPGSTEAMRRAAMSKHMRVTSDGRITAPEEKSGIVGTFCRIWDIPSAIAAFGLPYKSAGRDRYTYTGGSTYGGAVSYDGRWLYSHHATDPAGGQLCNAFDLVRIHRFGSKDYGATPDTPITKMPSFIAMADYCGTLPEFQEARAREIVESFADMPDTAPSEKPEKRPQSAELEDVDKLLGLDEESSSEVKESAKADEPDTEWATRLDTNSAGVKSTANNYWLLISNLPAFKGAFQTDIFANRKQITRALPWDQEGQTYPRDFTDTDRSEIAVYFSGNGKFAVNGGKDNLSAALDKAFNARRVHPVREMLKALPKWDGKVRIETLFCRYLGAEDTELNRTIARKHLTAAVKRVMEPGCKYDQVLVLVGPEGTGKSSIIEKLAMGEWYQDSNIEVGDKDAYQNLNGRWLIEMAELADYESKSVASYKNFISSTVDRYRPSYGRETISVPRQCVFFATTNENDFLKGRTGNRRFWVLDCPGSPEGRAALFDGTIDAELPQIWAEAYHYYQERMPLVIDAAMGEEMRSVQAKHEILLNDDTAAVIRDYIWRPKPVGWRLKSLEWKKAWFTNPESTPEGQFGTTLEVPEYFCVKEIAIVALGRRMDLDKAAYSDKNLYYILDHMKDVEKANQSVRFGDGLGVQKAYRVVIEGVTDDVTDLVTGKNRLQN